MITDKDLEDLLRQARLSTTAQQDERILADALAAIDPSAAGLQARPLPTAADNVAESTGQPAVFPLRRLARGLRRHWRLSTTAVGLLVLLIVLPLAFPRAKVADSDPVREVAAVTESPEKPAPPTRGTGGGKTFHARPGSAGPHEIEAAGTQRGLHRESMRSNSPELALQRKRPGAAVAPARKIESFGIQTPAARPLHDDLQAMAKSESRDLRNRHVARRGTSAPTQSFRDADRPGTDEAKIEAEAKQIAALAAARDIDGLVKMLSAAEFVNKVAAAEHLAKIGDQRALADLQKLNRSHGGWWIGGEPPNAVEDSETRAAFAWAIWSILHRDLTEEEQIAGLFDLLEGKGRAVPEDVMAGTVHLNFDVGRRVGRQLEKHDDPAVVARLRRTKNKGAAISAVKMEVRGMDKQAAIDRCVQIARDEEGAGRYGAIQVLGSFGSDAFDDLDELARQGHSLAITVLGYHKGRDPKALELICWHLTNNSTYKARLVAVNQFGTVMDRPGVVPALIKALYDPQKSIRHDAASLLSLEAYFKKSPHLDELEEAMLIARNHPDEDVRQLAVKALEKLGSKRMDEPLVDPPPIRTSIVQPPVKKGPGAPAAVEVAR